MIRTKDVKSVFSKSLHEPFSQTAMITLRGIDIENNYTDG